VLSGESVLEIRPIFEAEGFGKELTPELRAQEQRLRAEIEPQWKAQAAGSGDAHTPKANRVDEH